MKAKSKCDSCAYVTQMATAAGVVRKGINDCIWKWTRNHVAAMQDRDLCQANNDNIGAVTATLRMELWQAATDTLTAATGHGPTC
jgi:hypothetical protein